MRDCSRRGDIILDTFLGSGTPFMAAERTGRRGFGMEIDSLYVDVAIRRYQRPRQTGCQLRVKTRHAHRSNQLRHSITPSARPSNDGGTVRP
jgi:DNA modification methylase